MSAPLSAPPKASFESIRSTDLSTMPIHRLDSRDSIRRKPVPASSAAPNISLQDLRESDGEASLCPEPSEIGLAITDSATIPSCINYSYALPPGAALASARKPSSASTASSATPLRSRTARNPLDKPLVTIMPDQLHRPAKWDDVSPVPRTVITRRPRETESLRQSPWRWAVYSWAKEIVCVCVAICCVVILFSLLAAFDGKPVPSLSSTVSPSAAIQFPLTLAIISLLILLSSCISQWKWLWFQTSHVTPNHPAYLSDFERFDAASRSVLGSFLFMLRFKASSTPAWFGALLVVILLVTAPVTQMAVNYKQAYGAVTGVATAETLQNMNAQSVSLSILKSAAEDGVMNWEAQSTEKETLAVQCSTADCTFPTVLSLGLCSQVEDITSFLDTPDDGTISLSGISDCELGTGASYELTACKTPGSETISNSTSATSAIVYSMPLLYSSYSNDSSTQTYGALEAIFSLCVNAFSVTVASGVESRHLLYTKPLESSDFAGVQVNCSFSADVGSCVTDPNNDTAVFLEESTEFAVAYSALEELALAINTAASGRWKQSETQSEDGIFVNSNTSESGSSTSVTARNTATKSTDANSSLVESISEAVFGLDTTNTSTSRHERVSMLASSLAQHLTQAMLDSASQSSSNTTGISTVTGIPLMPQATVSVTWAATTLLILQTLGAIVLLVLTAVSTTRRKAEVLKTSAMAQLVALSEGTRKVVGGLDDVDTLNRKAKVLRVVQEDNGLVLGMCTTMPRPQSRLSYNAGRNGGKNSEERV